MEPSWNLTSGLPRTTPEPIWAQTPKLSAVGEKTGSAPGQKKNPAPHARFRAWRSRVKRSSRRWSASSTFRRRGGTAVAKLGAWDEGWLFESQKGKNLGERRNKKAGAATAGKEKAEDVRFCGAMCMPIQRNQTMAMESSWRHQKEKRADWPNLSTGCSPPGHVSL